MRLHRQRASWLIRKHAHSRRALLSQKRVDVRAQSDLIGAPYPAVANGPAGAPNGGSRAAWPEGLSPNVVESADAPELAADRVSGGAGPRHFVHAG